MSEAVSQSNLPEIKDSPKSAEGVYLKLLGLDKFPRSPEFLPGSIFLPVEAIGDFESSIVETQHDRRERGQTVYWDGRRGQFTKDKLSIGSRRSVGRRTDLPRLFFGKKGFLFWHTHPGSDRFSVGDIAYCKSGPRDAFIDLVGGEYGVRCILQTTKSARLPLSAALTMLITTIRLKRWGLETAMPESAYFVDQQISYILEKEGYGYYSYSLPKTALVLRPGFLQAGLNLTRVPAKPPPED